jgi:LysR family transcriptional regulator, nitrogen assimilation regulatory protein
VVADIVEPRILNDLVLASARHRPATRLAGATAALLRGLDLAAAFQGRSATEAAQTR